MTIETANMQLDAVQRAVAKVRMKPQAAEPKAKGGDGRSRVTKIRDRHHTIARLVASNLPKAFICKKMGLTWNTLTLLMDQTPAFQELVSGFRAKMDDPDAIAEPGDYTDILERCMVTAELEIHDRLMEEPEKLSISELHKISRDAADRLGFSKHSVNLNVNITLAERLESSRRRRTATSPPAGAGDRGGVLSVAPPLRSAPPQLDLKAEPGVPTSPAPATEHPAPPPAQPPSEGVMSLREVLVMHNRTVGPLDPPVQAMSDRVRPRNTFRACAPPILTSTDKINRRLR